MLKVMSCESYVCKYVCLFVSHRNKQFKKFMDLVKVMQECSLSGVQTTFDLALFLSSITQNLVALTTTSSKFVPVNVS